jgi:hypothetical protein
MTLGLSATNPSLLSTLPACQNTQSLNKSALTGESAVITHSYSEAIIRLRFPVVRVVGDIIVNLGGNIQPFYAFSDFGNAVNV